VNPPAFVPEDGEVVLVVDDNEPLRESRIRMLKSAGIGASSVQEALRLHGYGPAPVQPVVSRMVPTHPPNPACLLLQFTASLLTSALPNAANRADRWRADSSSRSEGAGLT
jgi:hypothetical protein